MIGYISLPLNNNVPVAIGESIQNYKQLAYSLRNMVRIWIYKQFVIHIVYPQKSQP